VSIPFALLCTQNENMSEAVAQLSVCAKNESLESTSANQTQDEHAVKKPTKAQRRKVTTATLLFLLSHI